MKTIESRSKRRFFTRNSTALLVVGSLTCLMGTPLNTAAQGSDITAVTNRVDHEIAINLSKTNKPPETKMLSQYLRGSVPEILKQNKFITVENGLLRRDKVTVGELRRLLKYEDWQLSQLPGTSAFLPAYSLQFADVCCIVEVAEERKSIRDDDTQVTVTINTNPVPVVHNPTSKRVLSKKIQPSSANETK